MQYLLFLSKIQLQEMFTEVFNWQADSSNEKENCIFLNFLIYVYVWAFLKWYFPQGPPLSHS